jgi:hypothetical protein
MALAKMAAFDRRIIFECLTAAARGPFFSDADLSILFGLDRRELLGIVARIPRIDDSEPNVRRAIGHTLLDLLGYPHGKGSEWSKWVSVSPAEVEQVADRWRALQPPVVYESFQVFGPARIGGKYYRVVGYQVRGGGSGLGGEVWNSGRWLYPNDGPGCREIMAAVPASSEELQRAGVDCSPLPSNYDPHSVESESAAGGTAEDAEQSAIADGGRDTGV